MQATLVTSSHELGAPYSNTKYNLLYEYTQTYSILVTGWGIYKEC